VRICNAIVHGIHWKFCKSWACDQLDKSNNLFFRHPHPAAKQRRETRVAISWQSHIVPDCQPFSLLMPNQFVLQFANHPDFHTLHASWSKSRKVIIWTQRYSVRSSWERMGLIGSRAGVNQRAKFYGYARIGWPVCERSEKGNVMGYRVNERVNRIRIGKEVRKAKSYII
jgi:hypothetical protein